MGGQEAIATVLDTPQIYRAYFKEAHRCGHIRPDYDSRLGYMVSFVACVGGAAILLAPDRVSIYAERKSDFSVTVERFGSTTETVERLKQYERR